jgi:hypothetical protein
MQGGSFGQGVFSGFRAGVMGGVTGGFSGGIMGGLNALSRGRDFWTGDYKQYDLQRNYIASADGTMFEEYAPAPSNATVDNTSKSNVYYKPEKNEPYGIKNVVKPGKWIDKPVDGIATSYSKDMVFKIPDGGRVRVLLDGSVIITNPTVTGTKANLYSLYTTLRHGKPYQYGWMPLSQLDSNWEMLFRMALIIK